MFRNIDTKKNVPPPAKASAPPPTKKPQTTIVLAGLLALAAVVIVILLLRGPSEPHRTVQEIEDDIPYIEGQRLNLRPGIRHTVYVDHTIFIPSIGCHYIEYQPEADFELTYPEDVSRYYLTPKTEGRHRLTVALLPDTGPDKPAGC